MYKQIQYAFSQESLRSLCRIYLNNSLPFSLLNFLALFGIVLPCFFLFARLLQKSRRLTFISWDLSCSFISPKMVSIIAGILFRIIMLIMPWPWHVDFIIFMVLLQVHSRFIVLLEMIFFVWSSIATFIVVFSPNTASFVTVSSALADALVETSCTSHADLHNTSKCHHWLPASFQYRPNTRAWLMWITVWWVHVWARLSLTVCVL